MKQFLIAALATIAVILLSGAGDGGQRQLTINGLPAYELEFTPPLTAWCDGDGHCRVQLNKN